MKRAADELAARHSQGLVASYAIFDMFLVEYTPRDEASVGDNQILVNIGGCQHL